MKKNIFIFLAFFLLSVTSNAQNSKDKPDWINFNQRNTNFPQQKYLLGFISEYVTPQENYTDAKSRIESYTRTQLAESVQLTIKSITKLNVIVENQETYNLINKASISLSELKINGLTEAFYFDKKQGIYYAFAYAEKTDVIDNYSRSIALKFSEIESNLEKAFQYQEREDKKNALKSYFSNMPIFREMESEISILAALNGNYKPLSESLFKKKSKNEQQIAQLIKSETNTLNDVAFFMAFSLNFQIKDKAQEIKMENFTLSATNSGSDFSRLFKEIFHIKLSSVGFNINANSENNKETSVDLKGTYWENGEMLEIMCSVHDLKTGRIIASAENQISKAYLQENNIRFKTENINSLIDLQDSLNNRLVEAGNMRIDLFTNYGKENPIFEEGDTLKLYIKSNKECFVRFIYHLADGSKVLLLDNFVVEREGVNQVIKIAQEFECFPPFGTEMLQLNAQTSPFEALNTKTVDGYEFIADDLSKILSISRGFKPISNKQAKAQRSIIITTLARQ